MSYFLTIKNDRVEVNRYHRDASPYIVKSVDDFYDYMAAEAKNSGVNVEELVVLASSSMDFPEEFTKNAKTIALARKLKGGE